ncbi:hypothetical protein ABBQ38_003594 [Trebouxia sp. C0009 RCD-2024]
MIAAGISAQPHPCFRRWSKASAQPKQTCHTTTIAHVSRQGTIFSLEAGTQLEASETDQGSTSLRTPTSSSNGHVQMQVARFVKPGQRDPPIHKLVPPPRQGKAAAQQLVRTEKEAGQRHPAAGLEQRTSAHNRAVRAEMASMATELQTKKSQLGKADIALRQRDSEIAALHTTLSEHDAKLQASRSELAELQLQVKSHEESLQHTYNQLAEASRDKARVRQQLLDKQAELTGVHTHLVEWSQELHQLKSIMDTLEEEDMLLDQAGTSTNRQVPGVNSTQTNSTAKDGSGLRALTAQVSHQTESAISASTQAPQDGMELLEGIANLSTQMVGEAKEDVELFNRASGSTDGNSA